MGLTIGVRVKRQYEAFMSTGMNPKGTQEEIEEHVSATLRAAFPNAVNTYGCSVSIRPDELDFNVRFSHYGDAFGKAGYTIHDMYLALLDYVLRRFNADYGIDMHVYYSG